MSRLPLRTLLDSVAWLGLALSLACSDGSDPPLQSKTPSARGAAPSASGSSVSESSSASPARFAIRAEETPRLEILNSLAASEGFNLSGPTDGLGRTTATFEGQSVEVILAALLHDVPFSLHYRAVGPDALVRLDEVELWPLAAAPCAGDCTPAEPATAQSAQAAERAQAVALAERVGRGMSPSAHEVQERLELRREREALAFEQALLDVESEDPLARHAAVPFLGGDARILGSLALSDPDPRVRLEAVEQLGFGDPDVAIPILEEAALDPDPSVSDPAKIELEHLRGLASED